MFDTLKLLQSDAILGIMTLFRADQDPRKVDLSIGVYQDESGLTPVLECVKRAEREIIEEQDSKTYVAIAGNSGFNSGVENLLFGPNHPALAAGRVATVQTPGGSGAISVLGHVVQRAKPNTRVYLSDPSWPNHLPLLRTAGLQLEQYPYYDYDVHRIDFEALVDAVEHMHAGDIVLLHGCCHNPCGADLSEDQWNVLAELCNRTGVLPFIDSAYQGLAEGLDQDAYGLRVMAERVPELLITTSCSKNFGLYRERVGAACVVSATREQRDSVFSNLSNVARSIYSMPPDHGAIVVSHILNTPELREEWFVELSGMRERLKEMRALLGAALRDNAPDHDFSHIERARGMFSFVGISSEQVDRIKSEFAAYMVNSSRINIAGISERNLDYLTDAVRAVGAAPSSSPVPLVPATSITGADTLPRAKTRSDSRSIWSSSRARC